MFTSIKKLFKKAQAKKKKVIYPRATVSDVEMKTYTKYKNGWPVGAVVHFTAGRYEGGINKALDSIKDGAKNGLAFLCIGNDGGIAQGHSIDEWGSHAGRSGWPGLGEAVSSKLIGIEMNNAGKLTKKADGKFYSWFGTEIPEENVRFVTEKTYGCPEGYYHKYTKEQEDSLIELIMWLKFQRPDVFNLDFVLGHHEVAGRIGIGYFRKNDPGGSLSCSMPEFRSRLESEYDRRRLLCYERRNRGNLILNERGSKKTL